jgi:hypothetical protein
MLESPGILFHGMGCSGSEAASLLLRSVGGITTACGEEVHELLGLLHEMGGEIGFTLGGIVVAVKEAGDHSLHGDTQSPEVVSVFRTGV